MDTIVLQEIMDCLRIRGHQKGQIRILTLDFLPYPCSSSSAVQLKWRTLRLKGLLECLLVLMKDTVDCCWALPSGRLTLISGGFL